MHTIFSIQFSTIIENNVEIYGFKMFTNYKYLPYDMYFQSRMVKINISGRNLLGRIKNYNKIV